MTQTATYQHHITTRIAREQVSALVAKKISLFLAIMACAVAAIQL